MLGLVGFAFLRGLLSFGDLFLCAFDRLLLRGIARFHLIGLLLQILGELLFFLLDLLLGLVLVRGIFCGVDLLGDFLRFLFGGLGALGILLILPLALAGRGIVGLGAIGELAAGLLELIGGLTLLLVAFGGAVRLLQGRD